MPGPIFDDQALARAISKLLVVPYGLGIRATAGGIRGVEVAFTPGHPAASKWLARHSLTLAKQLNDTTRQALRTALAEGIKLGESRDQLAQRVRSTVSGMAERRARLIAQTESIAAYGEASLETMRQAKADGTPLKKRWLDHQKNACEICLGLHNTTIDLEEEFDAGRFGMVMRPPAHPGCRCANSPVYDEEAA